jgi:molecular chaperone DnaJ|tara:strand:+ start:1677 stop:2294 length:618 start_codon:yes stop_codon:yes gene_type:complete
MDPYEILGVSGDADKKTIKKAYRTLAAQHHPDRGGEAEKFKEVAEAYSILSDDQKKHEYDHRDQGSGGFSFEDLFGRGHNPFEEFFGSTSPQRKKVKKNTEDSDVQFNLRINLEQIKRGASHTINFVRNKICLGCNGSGGAGQKGCGVCAGSGVRTIRPTPFFVQQTTCPFCNGMGFTFEKPCVTCNKNGYVQVQDRVVVKIEEG